MRKLWLHITLYICLPGAILINGCKTEKRVEIHDVQLNIHVEDDLGKQLDGIAIYIFNNYENYIASVKYDFPIGYERMDTLNSGRVVFNNMSNIENYWVFISYRDSARYLNMKNYIASNTLLNLLHAGSITSTYIKVIPSNCIISFWSPEYNSDHIPVKVSVRDSLFGMVESITNAEPSSPFDEHALTFNREPGRYSWKIKGENDCLWIGDTLLKPGEHIKIKLGSCDNGLIAFWAEEDTETLLPLTIILNYTDTLSPINNVRSSIPSNCQDVNTSSASRPAGNYTYSVFSASRTCVWAGRFTLNKTECKIINLKACEN